MERTIDAQEAGRQIDALLRDAKSLSDHFVVERDGRRIAALVPIEVYDQWKRAAFFDHARRVSERAGLSTDEADELAAEAVAWARGRVTE